MLPMMQPSNLQSRKLALMNLSIARETAVEICFRREKFSSVVREDKSFVETFVSIVFYVTQYRRTAARDTVK